MFGADIDTDAMHRAAAVVDPDAVVEALYVLKVPAEHELPEGFEEQEYEARCALDVARLQARARGLKVRVKLIRTRNPGRAIVEEALRAPLRPDLHQHRARPERRAAARPDDPLHPRQAPLPGDRRGWRERSGERRARAAGSAPASCRRSAPASAAATRSS